MDGPQAQKKNDTHDNMMPEISGGKEVILQSPSVSLSSKPQALTALQAYMETKSSRCNPKCRLLPAAPVPGWHLLPQQPQGPLSGQRQTPAWGLEGPGLVVAVSPPQKPNPEGTTGWKNKLDKKASHQPR